MERVCTKKAPDSESNASSEVKATPPSDEQHSVGEMSSDSEEEEEEGEEEGEESSITAESENLEHIILNSQDSLTTPITSASTPGGSRLEVRMDAL